MGRFYHSNRRVGRMEGWKLGAFERLKVGTLERWAGELLGTEEDSCGYGVDCETSDRPRLKASG